MLPGFSAESSDYHGRGRYRASGVYGGTEAGVVELAVHWGELGLRECRGEGIANVSAILWGIPWGQSWEDTCAVTPGPQGRLPDRCVNTVSNIWGEWDNVPDDRCTPKWGGLASGTGCPDPGIRRYSAILWDIPPGQSWEDTCVRWPAPAGTPVAGQPPTRCVNTRTNIWGEWDVPDASICCDICEGCLRSETVCDPGPRGKPECRSETSWDSCCTTRRVCPPSPVAPAAA